jgi:hypothetical protein
VAKRCPAWPKKSDIFGLEITRKANQSPVDVGVIGMTGLLLEGELNPQELKYAETIRVCADALLTIINDILDYSKTESAKLELDLFDFDLIQMVRRHARAARRTRQDQRPRFGRRNRTGHAIQVARGCGAVETDPYQCHWQCPQIHGERSGCRPGFQRRLRFADVKMWFLALWHHGSQRAEKSRSWTLFWNSNKERKKNVSYTAKTTH